MYTFDGKVIPESNVHFNKLLKSYDHTFGIMDVKDLTKLAEDNGIELIKIADMLANNKTIIWKKR